MRGYGIKRWIALVVISVMEITTVAAQAKIYSRDFGSDDAECLARLATAELPEGTVTEKADLMLDVLEYVWEHGCSIPAAATHYPSAVQGTYIGTVPDEESWLAVELIYNGWEHGETDNMLVTVTRVVWTLEWTVPLLCITFLTLLLTIISICLGELQRRIERRYRA